MLLWYIYVLICSLVWLWFLVIWPNFSYLSSVNESLSNLYLNSPYSLAYSYFIVIFGILIWIVGYFSKNPRIRKNLFLIAGFTILWFFALYFGFMIGLFKEYTFYYW